MNAIEQEDKYTAWRPREWLAAFKPPMAKATYHAMEADQKPRALKVGRSMFITESPSEWLRRVGKEVR